MNKADPKNIMPLDQDIPTLADDEAGLIISCEEVEPNVRKSFRVPLDQGMVTCVLNNKKYDTADLSMYGVGLHITDPEDFRIGEIISSARIEFPDRSFEVDVRVVHISPREGGKLICGMQIVQTHDAGYIDWMSRVIAEMKAAMLSVSDVFK